MKLTVLLVLALAGIATATPFHRAIGLKGPVEPRCDGPECPGGCCPEPAYICCDNGYFCAATEADCPPIKKEEVKQDCPGTECPGGCCPNAGWFCCPGDEYCAASEEYCKRVSIAEKLISMAAPKKIVKQDCPGTECPGGCCPNAGWFCCPGDEYCAASEEYCKKTNIAEKLISMAAPKKIVKQDCPGTECPGGCCPNAGWFCCPGDEYCAASEEYCKKTNFAKVLIAMAAPVKVQKEIKQDCPGTECPGGCCPNVGWFCCPGDEYCAASEEYCKKTTIAEKMISMAAPKKIVKQDCPGTECPGGCCPNAGWFCCPGDEYCAASEEYCKKADFAKILMSMAAPKKIVKQDCPGTECPGGCCPNAGWFCCPGDEYCAASEEYCKKINIAEKLIGMAAPKKHLQEAKQDCPGTQCPAGCCPNAGWFCCADNEHCAASEEYCKKTNYAEKLIGMATQKRALPLKVIRA